MMSDTSPSQRRNNTEFVSLITEKQPTTNINNNTQLRSNSQSTMRVLAVCLLILLGIVFWSATWESDGGLLRASSAKDTVTSLSVVSPFVEPPKVVILPGPHKTGSTSVQQCMVSWTLSPPERDSLESWLWAIPSEQSLEDVHMQHLDKRKRFAPLLAVLRHSHKFDLRTEDKNVVVHSEEVSQAYRDAISTAWRNGKNLVLGAEAMDYMVNQNYNGSEILEGILDVLPWEDTNRTLTMMTDVEAVVTYRAPRVDHLVSIWHQDGRQNQSLSHFLISRRGKEDMSMSNSLALVLRFLERGVPTTLIDMSGVYDTVHHEPFGMCQVIACDVLRVECDKHHQISTVPEQSDTHLNAKHGRGEMDLSSEQLADIDATMNRYDCSLRASLLEYTHEKKQLLLRILYSNELFRHCYPEVDDYDGVTFQWMVDKIQKTVSSGRR